MTPTTVLAAAEVVMTIDAPLQHLCPFRNERDEGRISIAWRTEGRTFELHSLRSYLDSWAIFEISHEAITERIQHDLGVEPGIADVTVSTRWLTAGLGVTCSTSPIRADQP